MSYFGKIEVDGENKRIGSTLFGRCNSLGAEVNKTATITEFDALLDGVTIHIMFQYANEAQNPRLNVNGLGSLPIYCYGSVPPPPYSSWYNGAVVSLTYDGAAWIMNDFQSGSTDLVPISNAEINSLFD